MENIGYVPIELTQEIMKLASQKITPEALDRSIKEAMDGSLFSLKYLSLQGFKPPKKMLKEIIKNGNLDLFITILKRYAYYRDNYDKIYVFFKIYIKMIPLIISHDHVHFLEWFYDEVNKLKTFEEGIELSYPDLIHISQMAAQYESYKILEWLIKTRKIQSDAYESAIVYHKKEVYKFLEKKKVPKNLKMVFEAAVCVGNIKLLNKFNFIDISEIHFFKDCISKAISNEQEESMRWILERMGNIIMPDYIICEAIYKSVKYLEILIEFGTSVERILSCFIKADKYYEELIQTEAWDWFYIHGGQLKNDQK